MLQSWGGFQTVGIRPTGTLSPSLPTTMCTQTWSILPMLLSTDHTSACSIPQGHRLITTMVTPGRRFPPMAPRLAEQQSTSKSPHPPTKDTTISPTAWFRALVSLVQIRMMLAPEAMLATPPPPQRTSRFQSLVGITMDGYRAPGIKKTGISYLYL